MNEREKEAIHVLRSTLTDTNGTENEQRKKIKEAWEEFKKYNKEKKTSNRESNKKHVFSRLKRKHGKKVLDAVSNGDERKLLKYISKEYDLHAKDNYGFTALHFAALLGYRNILSILLKHTLDVDITTNDGSSSLHLACSGSQHRIAYDLLKSGADPFLKNKKKESSYDLGLKELINKAKKEEQIEQEQMKREHSKIWKKVELEFLKQETHEQQNKTKKKRSRENWLEDIFMGKHRQKTDENDDREEFLSLKEKRKIYERKWEHFSLIPMDVVVKESDMPWPIGETNNLFMLPLEQSGELANQHFLRKLLRDEVLHWHPDKFILRKFDENEKEKILNRINMISQKANEEYQAINSSIRMKTDTVVISHFKANLHETDSE